MTRLLPALLFAALGFTALSPAVAQQEKDAPTNAAPQPDPVTHAWAFDFEYKTPNTIAIENADGSVEWYWYMTYKVTNFDQDELFFDPRIVIQNDAGQILSANLGIDGRVFRKVRELVRNPLLLSPIEVSGKVFKGEEYARESVAIWKITKADVDQFKIFVGGIYGEVKTVNDPSTGEPIMIPVIDALSGKPEKDEDGNTLMQPLQVHRTLQLHYKTPGTTEAMQDPTIKLKEAKDVMR